MSLNKLEGEGEGKEAGGRNGSQVTFTIRWVWTEGYLNLSEVNRIDDV